MLDYYDMILNPEWVKDVTFTFERIFELGMLLDLNVTKVTEFTGYAPLQEYTKSLKDLEASLMILGYKTLFTPDGVCLSLTSDKPMYIPKPKPVGKW